MKRTRPQLTLQEINSALPHPAEKNTPKLLCDSNGLYLQIMPSGIKSWIFRYSIGKRTRSMGLGPLRSLSLANARKKALELRVFVDSGVDPLETKKAAEKAAMPVVGRTFKRCAEEYLSSHESAFKNSKHFAQWRSTLEMYAYPAIGAKSVADITVADVIKCLRPIWERIPETATRLRGRIEKILGWAAVHGYRTGENPARWSGHLSEIFPKKSLIREVKHHTALPYTKMAAFIQDLVRESGLAATLFLFLILTATRTGEARGAKWSEINWNDNTWNIPKSRMKASRAHRVPLSTWALTLLKSLHAHNCSLTRPSEFVFPGRRPTICMSDGAAGELLKRMGRKDLTPHGCRSTFRDFAAECTAFQREVAEAALAHHVGGVEGAYQRGDFLEKRRALMQAWADFCATPIIDSDQDDS